MAAPEGVSMEVLLVLNTGSSSLKFQVFARDDLAVLAHGKVGGIGTTAHLKAAFTAAIAPVDRLLTSHDHDAALAAVLALIDEHDDGWSVSATVHRVVHGGLEFVEPVLATPEIVSRLKELNPLAPLHQPYNLEGIEVDRKSVV
jgi:acetate kinase